jgi:hypothetical protein
VLGEAGSRVTVVSLPARGRPPQAAARRAGLEGCREKSPSSLNSTVVTEWGAGMLFAAGVGPRPRPVPTSLANTNRRHRPVAPSLSCQVATNEAEQAEHREPPVAANLAHGEPATLGSSAGQGPLTSAATGRRLSPPGHSWITGVTPTP